MNSLPGANRRKHSRYFWQFDSKTFNNLMALFKYPHSYVGGFMLNPIKTIFSRTVSDAIIHHL